MTDRQFSVVLDPKDPTIHVRCPQESIEIKLDDDQDTLWVTVDGVTRLRIADIGDAKIRFKGIVRARP